MVDNPNQVIADDEFIETLDDLPMITVPNSMLPNIMGKVMDEHIRDQVKSLLIPSYLFILVLVYALLSLLEPSDLSWMDFFGMLLSSPESGLLSVFHYILNICIQLISDQKLRQLLIQGVPHFLTIFLIFGLVFQGLRVWIRSMHRTEKEKVEK